MKPEDFSIDDLEDIMLDSRVAISSGTTEDEKKTSNQAKAELLAAIKTGSYEDLAKILLKYNFKSTASSDHTNKYDWEYGGRLPQKVSEGSYLISKHGDSSDAAERKREAYDLAVKLGEKLKQSFYHRFIEDENLRKLVKTAGGVVHVDKKRYPEIGHGAFNSTTRHVIDELNKAYKKKDYEMVGACLKILGIEPSKADGVVKSVMFLKREGAKEQSPLLTLVAKNATPAFYTLLNPHIQWSRGIADPMMVWQARANHDTDTTAYVIKQADKAFRAKNGIELKKYLLMLGIESVKVDTILRDSGLIKRSRSATLPSSSSPPIVRDIGGSRLRAASTPPAQLPTGSPRERSGTSSQEAPAREGSGTLSQLFKTWKKELGVAPKKHHFTPAEEAQRRKPLPALPPKPPSYKP